MILPDADTRFRDLTEEEQQEIIEALGVPSGILNLDPQPAGSYMDCKIKALPPLEDDSIEVKLTEDPEKSLG